MLAPFLLKLIKINVDKCLELSTLCLPLQYANGETHLKKLEIMNYKLLQEAQSKVKARWSEQKIVRYVHQFANNSIEAEKVLIKLYK